jgi:hypothetical protein
MGMLHDEEQEVQDQIALRYISLTYRSVVEPAGLATDQRSSVSGSSVPSSIGSEASATSSCFWSRRGLCGDPTQLSGESVRYVLD